MKRSESFLVYGVTGVLVVILAIAIIFGNETQPAQAGDGSSADRLASNGVGSGDGEFFDIDDTNGESRTNSLLDELLGDDNTLIDGAATDEPVSLDDPVELVADRLGSTNPIEIPLNRTLGPSRTEENPASGARYRIVEVQSGDSTSVLIQRWCPGTDRQLVAALNETVALERLRPGQELVLPWVDTAILLEAQRARIEAPATVQPAAPASTPIRAQPGLGATTHTVQKGESLWSIAEGRVGAKKATGYIEAILRANDSISDASRVREGMKIVLP